METNKTIRILNLFTILDRGGAETMCMNIYRNIDRKKIQFDFLVYYKKRGFYEDEIESMGGRVYHIPKLDFFNWYKHLREAKLFFVNHPEYQIVHNHMGCNGVLILNEAKKAGVKNRIYHSHSEKVQILTPNVICTLKNVLKKLSQKKAIKLSNIYFACGHRAAEIYQNNEDIYILNNAIDLKNFSYNELIRSRKRKELLCEKKIIIGQVGRLEDNKNQMFSIDIINELIKINSQYRLWIIGDGVNNLKLKERVKELQLQNYVEFFGVRADVNELLQAIDIFLFPSIKEGLPVSCIEAQAAGLPCFFSDGFDPTTVITDNCTVLSLNDAPDKWAKAIIEKSNIKRKDMTSTIRKAGYDINDTSKYIENFYLSKVS